jgi:B12-binding domain/radical SAM domain protein of rhizo-twelve system
MRFALINPNWSFNGSIYFGCREPHLPLEYGYSKKLLEEAGHDARVIDGQLENLSLDEIRQRVRDFAPHFTVVTTAPSYLFWRCAPPELRVPSEVVHAVRDFGGHIVIVGPHASTTPRTTLTKLDADLVIMGECEEILPRFDRPWDQVPSVCGWRDGKAFIQGGTHSSDMMFLPSLRWPDEFIRLHRHHHHRFDAEPLGPGAEMEASRGCPYHCTFCAKDNFRDKYRKRSLPVILDELDHLLAQDVEYIYFIDEIFLPNRELLLALAERNVKFGMQTRIDLWSPELIDLLGRAGCVSIEAGVESITEAGRERLDKKCRLSTDDLADRLIHAKRRVPFVQANLIEMEEDDAVEIEAFRQRLQAAGVWANKPVPLFPYPGSPEYTRRWGAPDEQAWERAHAHYLDSFEDFSDVQEARPRSLNELELVQISNA